MSVKVVTHMLVDEHNGNVLALLGEGVERLLDLGRFCFGVDDEEVALRGGRVGDVLVQDFVSTCDASCVCVCV
jgi:hypothetical protein